MKSVNVDRVSAAVKAFTLVLLLAVFAPTRLAAQSVDVTVSGVIKDQTGAVLSGARVTATNTDTRLTRIVTSDDAGLYSLPPVPPAIYEIRAELAGFRPQVRATQLHVGTTVTLDLTLYVAELTNTIDVVIAAPVLETTKNTLSRLVTKEELAPASITIRITSASPTCCSPTASWPSNPSSSMPTFPA